MKTYFKEPRIEDKKLMKEYYNRPCIACGLKVSDPAHIKSQGAGGDDVYWNIVSLCRKHHSESHQRGWYTFLEKYRNARQHIFDLGWYFDVDNKLKNKVHK